MRSSRRSRSTTPPRRQSRGSGPLAFFVSVIILALGAIQLVSAFHTYALNLAELNGLRRQEAALVAKKQSLENEISRWDDKAYVTAQARERLGFVFPGEVSVHVKNSQAVTGEDSDAQSLDEDESAVSTASVPWYSELAYVIRKADEPSKKATKTAVDSGTGTTGTDASTPSGSSTATTNGDADGTVGDQ